MRRRTYRRQSVAALSIIAALLMYCVALAIVGNTARPEAQASTPKVKTVTCNNAKYERFEDNSGVLKCDGDPVVIVHVPY